MADEKPVTPPANQPPAGPGTSHARSAEADPSGSGPARPGTMQANSAEAIPPIMRGPMAAPVAGPIVAQSRGAARVPTAQGTATMPRPLQPPSPRLQFQPIVHVEDMAGAVTFYELLGAEVIHGGPDGDYTLMQLGTVQIGLLDRPPYPQRSGGAVELNFCAAMPLDELDRLLRDHRGTITELTTDRDFGRRLHVWTPDGLLIRISQREPDVYS
jgi:predicted enzyme related to lactoylglutathione lyase